jgi:hypothetical protein
MSEGKPLSKTIEKQIDALSSTLDLDRRHRTVVKLSGTDDPRRKSLELLSGDWADENPWFVVDESGTVHALTSVASLMHFIQTMQGASNENFSLKLEKAIWQHFPIDFHDVWVVAMSELQKQLEKNRDSRILEVDIDHLIDRIHREHPNLFYHIKEGMIER